MDNSNITHFANLLDSILPLGGGFIIRNQFASGEYKGEQFTYKIHGDWCTIYPSSAKNSEEKGHIHIRYKEIRYAEIFIPERQTPRLTFWMNEQDSLAYFKREENTPKPPFVYIFPSFYDWKNQARPIEENQNIFNNWTNQLGKSFNLSPFLESH
jgi:hypothetical protein